jgi:general secretion pathway protein G
MTKSRGRAGRGGFTLIELLVVIVILGILATLYITQVVPRGDKARWDLTGVQMTNITQALDSFKMDHARYPESLQDLLTAPNYVKPERYQQGGYLKEVPTDGWGNEFRYRRITGVKGFELISLGADNQEGGEGYDKDIVK